MDPLPTRIAAVLVLVYPKDGEPTIVLTKRTETVADHQGQVSLPGGSQEPEDASLAETALREAQEELGIPASEVQILGSLHPVHLGASNFLITPYVGTLAYRPAFEPSPHEVAEVIEVEVRELQDPATFREEVWTLRGEPRLIQFYQHGAHEIWGATGRVIQQFLTSEYLDLALQRVQGA